jgi:hypothetical protein
MTVPAETKRHANEEHRNDWKWSNADLVFVIAFLFIMFTTLNVVIGVLTMKNQEQTLRPFLAYIQRPADPASARVDCGKAGRPGFDGPPSGLPGKKEPQGWIPGPPGMAGRPATDEDVEAAVRRVLGQKLKE